MNIIKHTYSSEWLAILKKCLWNIFLPATAVEIWVIFANNTWNSQKTPEIASIPEKSKWEYWPEMAVTIRVSSIFRFFSLD